MRTQVIGREFIELVSVPSTNKYAADRLALSELQHGTVILAHEQTSGRGQRERSWLSARGLDLTFSIVLLPERLKVGEQFVLSRIAALAVHEVVKQIQPADVRIKWPNDVLVGPRKIAGILIKNEVIGSLITSSIIGIGVNVNSTDLSADLHATSLRLVTGRVYDRMELLERICSSFERRWLDRDHGKDESTAEFSEALWSRGRLADLELDGAMIKARPVDVDETGKLRIEHEDGQVLTYGSDRLRFGPRM